MRSRVSNQYWFREGQYEKECEEYSARDPHTVYFPDSYEIRLKWNCFIDSVFNTGEE